MKLRQVLSLVATLSVGVVAGLWVPANVWIDMKEGLIAFLGFLAASLVQVMPITANFLQSDRLSVVEAERLTTSLTRQQHYWMGLLSATIFAMVIVIVSTVLESKMQGPIFETTHFSLQGPQVLSFLLASSVCFVLLKMLGLFEGMMSLHRLRGELVINAAKRAAAEEISAIQSKAEPIYPIVPENYGQVLARPH